MRLYLKGYDSPNMDMSLTDNSYETPASSGLKLYLKSTAYQPPKSPQIQSTGVSKPQGITTPSTAKAPSTGLRTANRAGNILPSTDSPESFAKGLNTIAEQYQPTKGTEFTQSLSKMAARSTARKNRQTGLQFQTLLGQTSKGGVKANVSPTSAAWFGVMTDDEKTRAASIKNPVERGKFINSLDLNARAVGNLRSEQDKMAKALEVKQLQRTKNGVGAAIAAYVQAGNNLAQQRNALELMDTVGKRVVAADLDFLDDQQKATIQKFAQAGDYQAVADYFDNIEYKLQTQSREQLVQKSKALGYEHPVFSIVPEGVANTVNGISAIANTALTKIGEALSKKWTPIDPNSHIYDMIASSQAIQEGATERIEGQIVDGQRVGGIENEFLRGAARMGRSAASSALTNGLQLLMGGAAGLEGEALSNFVLATMSTSAAGQSAYRDLKEGKTSSEALSNAIATGVIESLTEKVSLDRFIKGLPELKADNAKQLAINFWNMLKTQAPIEGLEEVTGNILDQMWDIYYSGEDSEYSRRSQAILTQKILNSRDPEHYKPTQEDVQAAREQAFMDLFITQSAEAFATAALSSFLMVGAPTVSNAVDIARTRHVDVRAGNQLKRTGVGAVLGEIDKGLLLTGTETAQFAESLDKQIDRANAESVKKLSSKDIGKLERLNTFAVFRALGEMSESENTDVQNFARDIAREFAKDQSLLLSRNLNYEKFRRLMEARDSNALEEAVSPASTQAEQPHVEPAPVQEPTPEPESFPAPEPISVDSETGRQQFPYMNNYLDSQEQQAQAAEPVPTAEPTSTPVPEPASVETPAAVQEEPLPVWNDNLADEVRQEKGKILEKGGQYGNGGTAYDSENNPVNFRYAVVPLESLIISNDEYGNKNPDYPSELQPRNRERVSSQVQSQRLTNNLNPERLGENTNAQDGAPIVRNDGVVISGNGRSAAIRVAYQKGRGNAYENFIRGNAERFGLDPAQIPENPVLVRVVADNNTDWARLAKNLNVASVSSRSSTEKARSDAEQIDSILELLQPDAKLYSKQNKPFIEAFISSLPQNEQSELQDRYGNLNQSGLTRMTNAILAYAYGDEQLLSQFSESLDNDMKRVSNALIKIAPEIAKLKLDMQTGNAYNVPVVETILDALDLYAESKQYGNTVSETVSQASFDTNYDANAELVAEVMEYYNRKSEAGFSDFLHNLIDAVRDFGAPNQPSLLGGSENATIESALDTAAARANEREKGKSDFQRREGQFGRQSVSRTETPGSGIQSEQRPDVGSDSTGVTENAGNSTVSNEQNSPAPELEETAVQHFQHVYDNAANKSGMTFDEAEEIFKARYPDGSIGKTSYQEQFDIWFKHNTKARTYTAHSYPALLAKLGVNIPTVAGASAAAREIDRMKSEISNGKRRGVFAKLKNGQHADDRIPLDVETINDYQEKIQRFNSDISRYEKWLKTRNAPKEARQSVWKEFWDADKPLSNSADEDVFNSLAMNNRNPTHRDYSKWENEFALGELTKENLDRLPDAEEKLDKLAEETKKLKAEVMDFFETIADAPVTGEISGKAQILAEYWRDYFKKVFDWPDVFVNEENGTLDWLVQTAAGTRNFLVQQIFNGLASGYPDLISASFTLDLDNTNIKSINGAKLLFETIRTGHFDDIHKHFMHGMPQTIVDSIDRMYSFKSAYQNAKQATIESLYGYTDELKDSEKKRVKNALLKVKKGNSVTEAERIHNAVMNGAEITSQRDSSGAVSYWMKQDGVKKPQKLSKISYDFAWFVETERKNKSDKSLPDSADEDVSSSLAMDSRNPTITEPMPQEAQETQENPLPEGVGAASYAFNNDAIAAQLEYNAARYGTIDGQEKIDERGRVDNVYTNEIPAKMNDDTYVGRNVANQMSALGIAKERIGDYEDAIVSGYFNENPLTHKDMLDKANATMKRLGVEGSRKYLVKTMEQFRPLSLEDIALFQKTLVQLSHTDMSTQDYIEFASDFSHYASYLGHGLNLLKLLRKIDPNYELNELVRIQDNLNRDIAEKGQSKVRNKNLPDFKQAEEAVETARNEALDDMQHPEKANRRYRRRQNPRQQAGEAADVAHDHDSLVPHWMDEAGKLLESHIKSDVKAALRKIGVKMSDIIREGNPKKEAVAKRIADMLIEQYGIPEESAQRVGKIVVDNFNQQVQERSQETLKKMFKEKSPTPAKNQDRILKQFSDLANLGAFSSSDYAEQAAAKIFGYNYIRINQDLIDEFRNTDVEDEKARDEIIGRIQQDIADQIEPTLYEKYVALQYLGMLGSLKTILIRNPGGNLGFQPIVGMKNVIAAGIESGAKSLGIDIEKTRTVAYQKEDYKAWFDDFGSIKPGEASKVRQLILQGGKYVDNRSTNEFMRGIQDKRTIFGRNNDIVSKSAGRLLEKSRRYVTDIMDLGDAFFARHTYAATAARYLKAQGVTFNTATEAQKEAAREIAVREAAEATYRDNNQFAEAISKLGRSSDERAMFRFVNFLSQGILPFRKTPANIAVRAVEYSPLGLVKTLYDTTTKLFGSNKITGNDLINEWAKLLTGTGLFLLGAFLKRWGMFGRMYVTGTGALENQKKRGFMRLQGWQEYSLKFKIGNEWRYYNADWLAPEAIPVFLGANFAESMEESGLSFWDSAKVAMTVADPLINMSMLSGLNNAIDEAATYGQDNEFAFMNIIANAMWSNFTQAAVPQLIKQIPAMFDNTRNKTFIDRNTDMPSGLQRKLGSIPYLPRPRIDYIDEWGRTQENYKTAAGNAVAQILSPAYQSIQEIDSDVSRMENELLNLYDRTQEPGVLPTTANSYFELNGQRHDMTQAEYISYATQRGQCALMLAQQLTDSSAYKTLNDSQRIAAVKGVYDYANQMAKAAIWGKADDPEQRFTPDSWVDKANALTQSGIAVHEYIIAKAIDSRATSAKITDSNGKSVTSKVKYQKWENGKSSTKTSDISSASVQAALEIRQSIQFSGSDAQKKYKLLFSNLGIAESVQGKSEQWLEKKLDDMRKKGSTAP